MTEIFIVKSKGKYKGFICHGHAEYAKKGSDDIVCAAISTLTINTINSLEIITKDEFELTTDSAEGDMSMFFKGDVSEGGSLLMESLELGLNSIVSQYGKRFVKVEIQEV